MSEQEKNKTKTKKQQKLYDLLNAGTSWCND